MEIRTGEALAKPLWGVFKREVRIQPAARLRREETRG
jgi:hypothetical protein